MAINFKLSDVRPVLTHEADPMQREWVGYAHSLSDDAVFEQNRGIWRLGPRAERERWATFSYEGKIVVVAEITDIEALPWPIPQKRHEKKAIVGRVLRDDHPVRRHFLGLLVDGHRNPFTYLDDPPWTEDVAR